MSLRTFLFPDPPRELPAERAVRITLRTLHIGGAGVLLGGHIFGVEAQRLLAWMWLTVGSGVAFAAVDLYGSFDWLLQVRGWLVLLKVALVCAVPFLWDQRVGLLLVVLLIGSVGSHMPGNWRHYSLLRGGVIGPDRRG
ncbi:MAG: hypothetical protein HZA91_20730 [Verrucomicrobia bacterium]|nr:hypothetical protein [Verrucomicrobiota bacterium]